MHCRTMNVLPYEKLPATRNTATAAASSAKAAKIIRRTLRIGNDLFLMGHMIIHHHKEQRHIHTMGVILLASIIQNGCSIRSIK